MTTIIIINPTEKHSGRCFLTLFHTYYLPMCVQMGQAHTSSSKAILGPQPKSDQTNPIEGVYKPNICYALNNHGAYLLLS